MMKSKEWITENFEFLVAKYGGKYIGAVNEQVISVALTPRAVLENAKKLGKEKERCLSIKSSAGGRAGIRSIEFKYALHRRRDVPLIPVSLRTGGRG